MRGTLAALYSIDPHEDTYADHIGGAESGFARVRPHERWCRTGCISVSASCCELTGSAQIVRHGRLRGAERPGQASQPQRPLLLDWEYLSANGWLPLTLVEDRTQRFSRDGRIVLSQAKRAGREVREDLPDTTRTGFAATVARRSPRRASAASRARARGRSTAGDAASPSTRASCWSGDEVTIDGSERALIVGNDREHRGARSAARKEPRRGEYLLLG